MEKGERRTRKRQWLEKLAIEKKVNERNRELECLRDEGEGKGLARDIEVWKAKEEEI